MKTQNVNFDHMLNAAEIYISEAEKCGNNGLYLAGCIMFGAALEAICIAFILCNVEEGTNAAELLKGTNLATMISQLMKSNVFSRSKRILPVDPDEIRKLRNQIHPMELAKNCKITRKKYLKIREKFYQTKDHLLYWLTDDCEIEC